MTVVGTTTFGRHPSVLSTCKMVSYIFISRKEFLLCFLPQTFQGTVFERLLLDKIPPPHIFWDNLELISVAFIISLNVRFFRSAIPFD